MTILRSPSAVLLATAACACLSACAGGSPLLHPAHTLRPGQTRFSAGIAGQFALGEASSALSDARGTRSPAAIDKPANDYVRGALVAAAIAPGLSPFASGRTGTWEGGEAGLSYTGRTARIDARHALDFGSLALSAGIGASAILGHRTGGTSDQLDHLQLDGLSGWGADVPIVFGWRSKADVVWLWLGARGGYEQLRGSIGYVLPSSAPGDAEATLSGDVDGHRVHASALTGLAIGFRHVHAAIELQGGWHDARGTLWGVDTKVQGFTLTPAAALIGSF